MVTWIINRQLNSLERRLGESVDYLRHIARTSTAAFLKFMGLLPLAAHRGVTPRNLLFTARFVATKYEDCETCLQIVVNQAIEDKVNSEIVAAMVDGDDDSLDSETRLAAEFARAVLDDSPEQERLRAEFRTAFGERALVDISLAIAAARVFPTLKRSLGYAVSCREVAVQIHRATEKRTA
ncbi:MAG: hypothetical protein RIK87_24565 [Fuerstiella sp.]